MRVVLLESSNIVTEVMYSVHFLIHTFAFYGFKDPKSGSNPISSEAPSFLHSSVKCSRRGQTLSSLDCSLEQYSRMSGFNKLSPNKGNLNGLQFVAVTHCYENLPYPRSSVITLSSRNENPLRRLRRVFDRVDEEHKHYPASADRWTWLGVCVFYVHEKEFVCSVHLILCVLTKHWLLLKLGWSKHLTYTVIKVKPSSRVNILDIFTGAGGQLCSELNKRPFKVEERGLELDSEWNGIGKRKIMIVITDPKTWQTVSNGETKSVEKHDSGRRTGFSNVQISCQISLSVPHASRK